MAAVDKAGQADHHPAGIAAPVGRKQAGERGYKIDTAVVLHGAGQRLDIARIVDQLQIIPEPLHQRAGNRDRPFQAVDCGLVANFITQGGQQPGLAGYRFGPGIHQDLLKYKYPKMLEFAETTELNEENGTGVIGIVSAGYASTVVDDAIDRRGEVAHLRLGIVNPLCQRRIDSFLEEHDRVLVIEEGAPLVEESIRGKVLGKLSGHVPRFGELTSDDVNRALNYVEADYITAQFDVETLQSRRYMEEICEDCPFLPFYHALAKVDTMIAGDMGCVIGQLIHH